MLVLDGKSVFGGIAIGKIALFEKGDDPVKRKTIEDTNEEIKRFENAKEKAKEELKALYEKALLEVGEANAMIFDVHQMMLDDLDYIESVRNMIETQKVNAEFAVATTGDNFAAMFSGMDDAYMKERAADVKDISNRLIRVLMGKQSGGITGNEPVILVAEDLAPSETVQLDKSLVLSFVTKHGSTNSHTAILARTMNIPALIGVDFPGDISGKMAIVDGFDGKVYIEPDEETLERYQKQKEEEEKKQKLLLELKGKETITKGGKKINLYANIGGVSDVAEVLANDANGIGLFRSEFLYLQSETFPTEEEQFRAYKTVVETMAGKKVIVRTLDIGADKQVDYFGLDKEDNPALGYRAIRICLKQPDIFRTQLRAIYRASYYGTLSIMFPMIISVDEVRVIKRIVNEVKSELDEQEIPYGTVELGIMIETPAAVMISDLLAKEVDFFSIGTNDLTQYEFLYLQSETFPTEEEQFRAYKTVVETMAGKKVIVRTLDIGADKQVDYFGLDKEDNPALGYRAIRICLKQPDIFRTQLRAIYRASYYGTLSIMFPMIISVDEVRVIKRIVNEVKSELDEQEIPYGTVELGIMIETPAAVMISDLLAKEVDFFSIGTNDLTQYTLAIDRQNPKLDDFYNSHHEAVLRMIRMVVENGHKEGCWVGICGELGADTSLTETFVSMGIDELSVSPSMVLKVREAVRNIED